MVVEAKSLLKIDCMRWFMVEKERPDREACRYEIPFTRTLKIQNKVSEQCGGPNDNGGYK